jgi:hypothetical protein
MLEINYYFRIVIVQDVIRKIIKPEIRVVEGLSRLITQTEFSEKTEFNNCCIIYLT